MIKIRKDDMDCTLTPNLWSFIWHFLRGYKRFVIIFVCLAMITGLWGPCNSLLIKYMIDSLGTSQLNNTLSIIFWLAVFFVLNFEIHNLCWRGMGYINYKFQPMIKNQIISETFGYVLQHTQQFFQDNLAGAIATQINTLADNIERIVHDITRHLIRVVVLLMVSLVNMYYVHPKFFYALFIWLLVFASFSLRMSKKLVNLSKSHAAAESIVSGQIVDSITNTSNVQIFARRIYEISYLKKTLLITKKTFQAKEIFAITLRFMQGISLSIMLGFMLYFLIQLRMKQMVSSGDFALILGLSLEVGYMTWWAMEQVDELNKAVGKCRQSIAKLLVPLEIKDKDNASNLLITNGQITFSSVKFHYKGIEPLFQNKSVTIEAGQKVGLVGYSGSGKSTFVNLILRLYDVTDGQILIDGQDIQEVRQDSLREAIAMIPQDPSLFHRSLMENIRYGRIDASDEEVIEAAKRANAHAFITKLSQMYESLVGERGVKLSGGQRQRIAIARAILKNAPILILDEATSQLDSLTESTIQESLWELMQGKTTIVIAHRLSTLMHMDRILVFDQGKIIEDNTHTKLFEKGGFYRTLWDAQVGGFLPNNKNKEA
ncbi:ABC transporter ATP-binding protein [Candidatus Tisiphia endosymbiont of Thecophora atra]|uniref:ABC transporter ATP-binding protein n=1 Tax=Candidatus Tisiphia endosymbiont of Thecophora atra TaxID=3066258 RepID=UPI00312CA99C